MPPHRFLSILAVCLGLSASAVAQESSAPIRWRSGASPSPRTDNAGTQIAILSALQAGERHVVLQLSTRSTLPVRQALSGAGVELVTYLGGDAWFAAIDVRRLDVGKLAAVQQVAGVTRVERAWKLHPDLATGIAPQHTRVDETDPADPIVAVYVVFHGDVDVERAAARAVVENQRGRVVDVLRTIGGMVVELPQSRIDALASADPVQWIEPALPRMSDVAVNDSNRSRVQADDVQAGPYNLDGSGVTVMVYDGGYALASHNDFGGRLTVRDSAGLSDHATHVAATIGGDGSSSGGTFTGMAPGVILESYGFEYDGSGVFLYSNPGDLESDYNQAINTYGADLSNNSIGTNTEPNGFPCNIQGDYGVCSSVIDAIVRGSLGAPFRVVWANGNERQGSNCDIEGHGDYYSTAPPATAKNHIAVGALNSNNDSMTSFSSWGPTDDGRLKPDISGPGCQSNSDGGVTSAGSGSSSQYVVKCGTSMSAPTVTGCVALMMEDYRAQFPSLDDPLNSTVKILLAQEAVDLGNTGPDYQFGYGSVRVKDTIDFMRLGQFDEQTIDDHGASYVYEVAVSGGAPELKVTLAWDDVPGTPNVEGALVNDLDLRVIDPLGGRHYPWTLDPANPGASAVRTAEDHINNLEQVLVSAPIAGTWRVEVYGHDVPSGPQSFSICASHALSAGPFVQIGFPSGVPSSTAPASAETIQARVVGIGEAISAGPTLHYRFDGGAYNTLPMSNVGGDLYEATLPAAFCTHSPEFYVSASGGTSGAATSPPDAPAEVFAFDVEDVTVVFADNFDTSTGWSVTNTSITDGAWERGIPAGDGGRSDPLTDFDGSGHCFLTDNVTGNSDVDGGPTTITSPVIDMSTPGTYLVRFAAWFANDDFDADDMDVEISANGGGSWTQVMSIQNTSGWRVVEFDVAAHVTPTNNMVVRFPCTDNPNDSITEAALDMFEVRRVTCDVTPSIAADFTASTTSGAAPLAVTFTDTSTGSPTTWTWNFGDGAGSSAQHPSHTYNLPGTYTVSLDITGAAGSDNETKSGYIVAAKPPLVGTPFGSGSTGSLGMPTIAAHSDLTTGAPFYLVGGNLPPGTGAFLVFSLHKFNAPVDLSNGLILNVNVPMLLIAPATANAAGEAIVLVSLPAGFLGVPVHGQCIALDGVSGNTYATSGGVTVTLP